MARITTIHFKNENIGDITTGIKSGSLKLEKILDDNSQLKFGTCNSSKFSCTLLGASDLTGEEISVYQTVDGIKYKLFSGVITSCVLDKNKVDRNLIAYDKMYTMRKLNVWDWYNQLTFPIPLKDFRDSLFDYLGIVQVTQTLTNDTMLISKTVSQTEMSLETVLTAICELNGCYGIMNEEGLFEYLDLNNHTIKNISSNVRSSSEYELYTVKRIDCVQLMFEDGDVGVSYGDGSNKYQVVGNFLIYGKTEAELNRIAVNLFSVISDIVVTPANLELIKTDYSLRLGDRVLFTDRFGVEYTTIILKQELSGVQFINESCSCELDEYRTETTSDFESEIRKLMGKSNVLRRDINQTQSTIIDVEKGLQNQITQTANSLSIQISTLGKEISKEYDTYILKEVPTLENYPAIDWHEYLYPGNDTYPGLATGWFYTYETYFPHLGSVAYVEGTLDSYKFILDANGQFRWKQVQDTQVAYIQEQIHQLQVTDTELSDKIQTNTLTLTAQGERLETAEANIKANSKSLTTKISKTTYDKDKENMLSDINSQFQQLSNQISLCVTQKSYDANTVSALVVEYALSSSNTSAPTSGWSTTAPTANSGKYMWQRTSYRYADGSTKVSQVTCIQGAKGDTGVGIKSIITYYYLSKSSTSVTGGSWSTICPTYTGTKDNPKYYWTKQRITWDDNSVVDTTPVVDYGISSANQTSKTTEAKLELKIDKDDKGQIISMINASADLINLKSNRFQLSSTYATINKDGSVKFTSGEIGGWTIGTTDLHTTKTNSGYVKLSSGTSSNANFIEAGLSTSSPLFRVAKDGKTYIKSGSIGNWLIENNALYADYKSGGYTYRAYIQPPTSLSTWVYSIQKSGYNNLNFSYRWLVTADGDMQFNVESGKGITLNGAAGIETGLYRDKLLMYYRTLDPNNDFLKYSELGKGYLWLDARNSNYSMGHYTENNGNTHAVFSVMGDNPTSFATLDCRTYVWNDFHCNSLIQDSDANVKNSIEPLDKQKTANFIYSLIPSQFKFNGNHNRLHHGLIAQEVKEAMGNDDWGLFIDRSVNETDWEISIEDINGNRTNIPNQAQYSLRYTELIADLIATVQSQNERIEQLEKLVVS